MAGCTGKKLFFKYFAAVMTELFIEIVQQPVFRKPPLVRIAVHRHTSKSHIKSANCPRLLRHYELGRKAALRRWSGS